MDKNFIAIVLAASFASGCATIMNSDIVNVPVVTIPSGAKITLNETSYISPATVYVPRGKGDFNLHIEKKGYHPVDILLTESTDGWVLGNILLGGIVGLGIDYVSGRAYDIEPELLNVQLQDANLTKADDGSLNFILLDINQLPKDVAQQIKKDSRSVAYPSF